MSKLSLKKGDVADVDLALVIDKKSAITAKGPVGIEPLSADLALEVKNLAIRPFQPYFTESVQLDVTRGAISTVGKFSLTQDEKSKSRIKYTGNLSVSNLATIDKANAHDFIKWKQLHFQSLAAGYNPLFVNIKEISFKDFFAKIVINDGRQHQYSGYPRRAEKRNGQTQIRRRRRSLPNTSRARNRLRRRRILKSAKSVFRVARLILPTATSNRIMR